MRELIYKDEAYKAIDNCVCDSWDRISPSEAKMNIHYLVSDANEADRPEDDTVSRRYLLAEIDDLADEFSEVDENGLHSERWCGIMDSKGVIENAPSVTAEVGEWKWESQDICDNCGYEIPHLERVVGETVLMDSRDWGYCPNCESRRNRVQ